MSRFARDWLKLRESADLAARDAGLARRFAAALPRPQDRPLRLVDLGAGTGANCRALLQRIGGDQDWLLVDSDRDLIAAQAEEFTLWARRQGFPIAAGGGRMVITSGAARWSIASVPLDLAHHDAIAALAPDAMTAAALFDLVSEAWLTRLVALLAAAHSPLLAALTVDGRRRWEPALAEDARVASAFARHQSRDKGIGGPALGAAAAARMAALFAAPGFDVAEVESDWRLEARDRALLCDLIAGEARAAREAAPTEAAAIGRWERERLRHLEEGILRLTVGHRDTLALPG